MHLALITRVLRERIKGLAGWALGLVGFIVIEISVYPTIRRSQQDWSKLTESFPKAFQAIFRMNDYTSVAGFLSTELFSMVIPIIFIGIGASWGARAAAEEEENGTADILMSLPVSRSSILSSRLLATGVVLAAMSVIGYVSLRIGMALTHMVLNQNHLISALVGEVLIGAFFGSIALLVASVCGRRGIALGASLGLAIACFVLYSLAPLVSTFDALLKFNPFQWTLGPQPLFNGFDSGYTAIIICTTAAAVLTSFRTYIRHDIKS